MPPTNPSFATPPPDMPGNRPPPFKGLLRWWFIIGLTLAFCFVVMAAIILIDLHNSRPGYVNTNQASGDVVDGEGGDFTASEVFILDDGIALAGTLRSGVLNIGMHGIINGKDAEITGIETKNVKVSTLSDNAPAGLLFSANIGQDDIQIGTVYNFK